MLAIHLQLIILRLIHLFIMFKNENTAKDREKIKYSITQQ